MGEDESTYGRTRLWSMAAVYGIMGSVLLGLLLLLPLSNTWQYGFMVLMDGMLFFGFGATLYGMYRMDREENVDASRLVFTCKHCGRRFSKEKVWKLHERSCVEMKL